MKWQKKKRKLLLNENGDIRSVQNLIVPLRVTKRMKYDFTGERLSELDLIRIRINDLNFKKIILVKYFIINYYLKENFIKIILFVGIFITLLVFVY